MNLLEELRRRNVFRVGSAWVVGAWLIAQVAGLVTETYAAPPWILRTLIAFLGLALVPVLVLTWMFEFTPEGLRRQADVDRGVVLASRAHRRFDFVIAALIVIATGWLLLDWSARFRAADRSALEVPATPPAPVAEIAPNSIAVLPFADLGAGNEGAVLADGLAEELLGVLGRNRSLRVTARSSSFQFKGRNLDLREVGQKLGVRYVLEGSVRSSTGRVRVGAQLIEAATGVQLWNETYERTLADLFALQQDIAAEVARALEVVVVDAKATPAPTASVDAHLELLRARQLLSSWSTPDADRAITHLQRAITLDPNYAAAYALLADAMVIRALSTGEIESIRSAIAPLLDRALALDPTLGEALVLRGVQLIKDRTVAERMIRAGLELRPNYAHGYEMLAEFIIDDPARRKESMELIERAIVLDPLSARHHYIKGSYLLFDGDHARAEALFRHSLELDPRFRGALVRLAWLHGIRGEKATAIELQERALGQDPQATWIRESLAESYLDIGEPDSARAVNEPPLDYATRAIQMFERDWEAAITPLYAQLEHADALFDPFGTCVIATRHAVEYGDWERALALATRALGYTGTPPEVHRIGEYIPWIFLAQLLRGAGRIESADALVGALEHQLGTVAIPPDKRSLANLTRAKLNAYRGRTDEALAALDEAFQWPRIYWWVELDIDPVLDPLRTDPRFVALRARIETQLEEQRRLLEEMRRAGRVPDRSPP